jgi:hypothetical protein
MAKIGKFFRAVMSDWLARMSGPLTVPFAMAALLLPYFVRFVRFADDFASTTARLLFAILAVIAAMLTCYRVWAKEYDRAEAEKAKNEAAPHMDIRPQNLVPYSRDGATISDLFFYVELVLGEPSHVLIENFSLDISDQGHSLTTIAMNDIQEWQWIRKGSFEDGVVDCEALAKDLPKRGDPVRGWIHFQLPSLSDAIMKRSILTLQVNCEHGTCYFRVDGTLIQLDPDVKGRMRKRPKAPTIQPGPLRADAGVSPRA